MLCSSGAQLLLPWGKLGLPRWSLSCTGSPGQTVACVLLNCSIIDDCNHYNFASIARKTMYIYIEYINAVTLHIGVRELNQILEQLLCIPHPVCLVAPNLESPDDASTLPCHAVLSAGRDRGLGRFKLILGEREWEALSR